MKKNPFLTWCLGTWTGSLVLALIIATLLVLPIYAYRNLARPDKHDHRKSMPADAAYYHMNADGIPEQWHLLQPERLGVRPWLAGYFARYMARDERIDDEREVQFTILSELAKDDAVCRTFNLEPAGRFWLQVAGFRGFRDIHKDLFQLVTRDDLRVTSSDLCFSVQSNYFPLHHTIYEPYPVPPFAQLTRLGQETLTLAAGTFECDHYEVAIGQERLEIWVDPRVSPIGLVRARNDFQTLELLAYGSGATTDIPEMIQPLIDGRSTLRLGCASCHKS